MKAAILHGQGDIRYEETETPVPGKGEVLIKVMSSGICGSDVPRVLGNAAHLYPIILGHEFSGVIAELGEGTSKLKVGQRATAAPLIPCFECEDCARGNFSLCRRYSFIGSRVNGSFAEYVLVPAKNVVVFDDTVPFDMGAFFEPSTVALHGLRRAGYRGGEDVAILGGGTIGLFALQWARILGARSTSVFDLSDERLKLAARLGADAVVNVAKGDLNQEIRDISSGAGFGFVFETAGQNSSMSLAFEAAANRASVCFIGTSHGDLSFESKLFEKMNRKEFDLTGSWMSYSAPFPGSEWTETARYFANGKLLFDPDIIYKKFHLSEAREAFRLFSIPGEVKGKIMLTSE